VNFDVKLSVSSTARVMRLRVDRRTGEVVLTVPKRASRRQALEWAAGHRDWVERQLAAVDAPVPLVPGATVPLEGEPHVIDWNPLRPRLPRIEENRILVGGPEENVEGRLLRWLRRRALDRLSEETAEFAARAGVAVTRVGVGDPLSRWGSCSTSGAIRYSWRLILAPAWVRRATVAHEVAHRIHMDHSPRFHRLVETLLEADPKPARLWLRRHGPSLHRFGRAS
jgi:hypothetical protein